MGDLVPRDRLVRQGMKGVGGAVGGAALLLLSGLSGPAGWIVGGLLTMGGLVISTSRDDRTAGIVTAAAGLLILVSAAIPGVGPVANWLMRAGGIALLLGGGFSIVCFILNLRKRR